jgi:hypothetical protein
MFIHIPNLRYLVSDEKCETSESSPRVPLFPFVIGDNDIESSSSGNVDST